MFSKKITRSLLNVCKMCAGRLQDILKKFARSSQNFKEVFVRRFLKFHKDEQTITRRLQEHYKTFPKRFITRQFQDLYKKVTRSLQEVHKK